MAKRKFDPRKNSTIDTSLFNNNVATEKYAFNFNRNINEGSRSQGSLDETQSVLPWEQILAAEDETPQSPYGTGGSDLAVPHISTYAGIFNAGINSYYYYFDEALRDSQQNSLSMQRDGFVKEVRLSRELPPAMLPWTIEPDDLHDPGQIEVVKEFGAIISNCWRFQNIRKTLMKATFFGKYATHFALGTKKVRGQDRNVITNHIPINGDKLRYKFDGTPGVAIYPEFRQYFEQKYGSKMVEGGDKDNNKITNDGTTNQIVQNTNIGPALFLKTPYLRERFIIHEYNPSDTDYFFEFDMAAAVHGIGWRSDLYWTWQILTELRAWDFEGLQRVGVNGMLIGFFKTGSQSSKAAVWQALINLQKNNTAVFEVDSGWSGNPADVIQRLEPSQVGYDVLYQLITHFEDIIRRAVLGQNLSTKSASTGLGSGVADLQGESKYDIIKSDALDMDETLNSDLIPVLLKNNYFKYENKRYRGDELPFGMKFKSQTDDPNVGAIIQAASQLVQIGVELDGEDLRDRAGFAPPKSKKTAISLEKMTEGSLTPDQKDPTFGMTPDELQGDPDKGKPESNGKAASNGKPKAKPKAKPKTDKNIYDIDDESPSAIESDIDKNLFSQENELVDAIATYLVSMRDAKHIKRAAWNHANWSVCIYTDKIDEEMRTKLKVIEGTIGFGKVRILPDKLGSKLEDGYQDMHLDMYTGNTGMIMQKSEDESIIESNQKAMAENLRELDKNAFSDNQPPTSLSAIAEDIQWSGKPINQLRDAAQSIEEKDKSPSVMIAFYPSSKVANAIHIGKDVLLYNGDGEKKSDLHITLFYLGRMSDLGEEVVEAARRVCKIYAEYCDPFYGIVRNLGLFPPGEQFTYTESQEVLYAQVESTDLMGFRHELAQVLKVAQIPFKTDFVFNPHITLRYQDVNESRDGEFKGKIPAVWFEPQLLEFGSMTFVVGDDREEIMLGKKNDAEDILVNGDNDQCVKYDLGDVLKNGIVANGVQA